MTHTEMERESKESRIKNPCDVCVCIEIHFRHKPPGSVKKIHFIFVFSLSILSFLLLEKNFIIFFTIRFLLLFNSIRNKYRYSYESSIYPKIEKYSRYFNVYVYMFFSRKHFHILLSCSFFCLKKFQKTRVPSITKNTRILCRHAPQYSWLNFANFFFSSTLFLCKFFLKKRGRKKGEPSLRFIIVDNDDDVLQIIING